MQTDRTIEARRPDLILIDKIADECKIIDVAVPGDTRAVKKEEERRDGIEQRVDISSLVDRHALT